MTLAIPDPLQKKISKRTEIRWSAVARHAFERKLNELEATEKLLSESELTEEDAEKIGEHIKEQIRKRFEKRFA